MSVVVCLPCGPSGSADIPDDGLLFFNDSTNEYYLITMSGEILTWSAA
jgi:hypothetical protein